MTHEEVRPLLADYAAGTLPDEQVEQVRAHLASGCLSCLGTIYQHPVGLPRPARPIHLRRSVLPLVLLAGAVAAATAGWAWTLRRLQVERQDQAWSEAGQRAELAALASERAQLAADLETLRREQDGARRLLESARGAHAEAEAERTRLEGTLAETTTRLEDAERDLARRDRRIGRLLDDQPLRQLLDAPGLQLVPLEPAGDVRGVRGHALWHPGAGTLVVYAYDLPTLSGDRGYRLRLVIDGQVVRPEIRLTRQRSGMAVAAVRLNGDPARLSEVQVVRDPGEEPVLAGRMGPRAG
ncbi:MAG TPA: zf-HC2 domain-containing protein [Candidatus Binatia bacterium]|nr:zf-HC2 domain-containing protein [Candidatus Binatia bacterium]